MAQIFHRSMNVVARVTIFGAVLIVAALAWAGGLLVRSPYVTQAHVVRDQPVPFSHQHHVKELGLDCRYCHSAVESSAFAGMPATEVCMGCHSQIWKESDMLAPVRDSFRSNQPLQWTRVHDLPDFVYFNHSIHLDSGIGCESCHGRVDDMPLMRRVASLHMEWCLKCHRHPNTEVRPKSELFQFGDGKSLTIDLRISPRDHRPQSEQSVQQLPKAVSETSASLKIPTRQITDCVACHR